MSWPCLTQQVTRPIKNKSSIKGTPPISVVPVHDSDLSALQLWPYYALRAFVPLLTSGSITSNPRLVCHWRTSLISSLLPSSCVFSLGTKAEEEGAGQNGGQAVEWRRAERCLAHSSVTEPFGTEMATGGWEVREREQSKATLGPRVWARVDCGVISSLSWRIQDEMFIQGDTNNCNLRPVNLKVYEVFKCIECYSHCRGKETF